ncbi:hypothetical protein IEQ34_011509 [Dendrobium chrysotoxum]|uniref:Uncharacterized protein n=1 Tax=Dendrobium chrysotoxum TaxID=161865 RepID=A0AAV7GQY4_DENCH|nr:hypothetical protein IEQ34_011509 [Dendrobium chrysotoxum]
MSRLICDTHDHISFRSKLLDIHTRDPIKELEDLLKMLNLLDVGILHYEVRYLSRYVDEEYCFNAGLSTKAGRSHAHMLKKSAKVPEAVIQPSKIPPK